MDRHLDGQVVQSFVSHIAVGGQWLTGSQLHPQSCLFHNLHLEQLSLSLATH